MFLQGFLYIYRKKQLREMDRRIRYLQKRTSEFQVVEHQPNDRSRIFFSAWVELEDEQGQHYTYRIVGSDEFDFDSQYISIDSPLARAMIKKQIDDEVFVRTPSGVKTYYINKLWY